MTNNEFFEIYSAYQHRHMAYGTYYGRTSLLKNNFLPAYGELTPSDVTYLDINRIYDDMENRGLSVNTIFGVYAALLSYFKMAVEYSEVDNNPVSFAKPIRPEISGRNI